MEDDPDGDRCNVRFIVRECRLFNREDPRMTSRELVGVTELTPSDHMTMKTLLESRRRARQPGIRNPRFRRRLGERRLCVEG